ncbi:MAG: rod shape-determining protein MreD [Chloroflexi bacterium]|nr:rod shape-determining protein MreD [Chloroflexota bacterium]
MRSLFIAVPLLAFIAILQSAILTRFRILGGGFDLMLVVVLAWNLVQRENDGPLWAFIGGLLADVLSGGPLGASAFSLTTLSLIIAFSEGRFYQANWIVAVLASIVGTILYHLLYLSVLALTNHPVNFADTLALVTLPSTILNLLLMLPVYQATKRLVAQVSSPQVEIDS